jgi:dihydroorotase
MQKLVITRPDDWHLHLRDGKQMASVLPYTARQFARAIVMPNLKPAITTSQQASDYAARIKSMLPESMVEEGYSFEPLMTLYLTDVTTPEEIRRAYESGIVKAVKLYPSGATTHSEQGVTDIHRCDAALEEMQRLGLPLCVHGEVTQAEVDIFDREAVFIEEVLAPLSQNFPQLKIVFEHITTKDAAQYVRDAAGPIAATITPQHLLYSRNALFSGGLRPHWYCLPVLKREVHRQALLAAATSGSPRFFLGTDSAPHDKALKEHACGCAGCFTAPYALELYLKAFEAAGALHRFEDFASHFGPDFYGLPRNSQKVLLWKSPQTIETTLSYAEGQITPLAAGDQLEWTFQGLVTDVGS